MTHHGNTNPKEITKDSRGTLIEPGLRVAYNRSGDVMIGEIVELKRCERIPGYYEDMHILKFELLIKGEDGKVSKIKNYKSFVII